MHFQQDSSVPQFTFKLQEPSVLSNEEQLDENFGNLKQKEEQIYTFQYTVVCCEKTDFHISVTLTTKKGS